MKKFLEAKDFYTKPGWSDAFAFSAFIDTNYYTRNEEDTTKPWHASKGNHNEEVLKYPVDFEYNKITAVGAYSVKRDSGYDNENWIPTRWYDISRYGISTIGANYGYGLDLVGHTNSQLSNDLHIVTNYSLYFKDSSLVAFKETSSATAQVAGMESLMLSMFSLGRLKTNFRNYEVNPDIPIAWLAPEDVQGLLCISARIFLGY